MLSPTEIYDNVEALVTRRPDRASFGLELMDAVGAPRATITKLRAEAAGGGSFAWTRMLRFALVDKGTTVPSIEAMRAEEEAKPKARRSRIVIAYDGDAIAICDTKVGDEQRLSLDALAYEADILFPLGGHERHVPDPERLADIRATKHLSRLFDAVRDANPGWKGEADRHALNVFMARVMFCLFSDDVGIFEKDAFQTAVEQSTRADGGDLQDFLAGAFAHMDLEPEKAKAQPVRGWSKLPYVNGDLFRDPLQVPALDGRCRRHLLDCARLDWRLINPDIFGSMLQAVVDPAKRGELGMHYTSAANIMKVLRPILLDDLTAELERAKSNKLKLRAFLKRLAAVRVFDPACGSGNFLILAYKAMREFERLAFRHLGELPHEVVRLDAFYGIEIDDFACQAARLGLWIAQYQMDKLAEADLGQTRKFLPLNQAGRITCRNAAEIDWLSVCPAAEGGETVVVGNPQFRGSSYWSAGQKADMARVFKGRVKNWGNLDYVTLWFAKARDYALATDTPFGFVATNSIVQGVQVPELWPHLLKDLEIRFAYRSFKWSNLAVRNAGVTCVIVGMGRRSNLPKRLFDGDTVGDVEVIGPYLAPGTTAIVAKTSKPLAHDLKPMVFGNKPTDGGNLLLDRHERDALLLAHPEAERFVRRLYGSQELMKGIERYCLWVADEEVEEAIAIPELARRFVAVARDRTKEDASEISKSFADKPHRFLQRAGAATSHTIMVPAITSEDRGWLPVAVMDHRNIINNKIYGFFDGAIWQAAVLSSRLHRLWLETVGGKLEERPSYSNHLVWNTFPVPKLSEQRKTDLEEHWWEIDRTRKEAGFGRTLGDLYAPKTMPSDLRRAHEYLDETMETIFGSRRYRSDADRIEHLLQLYEQATTKENAR